MLSADRLTVKAGEALQAAAAEARQRGNAEVHGVHLLDALLAQEEGIVVPILQKIEVRVARVREQTGEALSRMACVEGGSDPNLSRDLRKALDAAEDVSRELEDEFVSTEHLLLGLTGEKNDAGRILRDAGATLSEVRAAVESVRGSHRVTDDTPEDSYRALARYSRDLTEQARRGKLDPVIGRDEEIRRVIKVLARRTKNNPVLIGEPGVGKTAIVEGLAQRMVEGDVPTSLSNKKLLQLDIAAMLAGAKYRGEFEERMKAVLKEITKADGRYVTFIDEIHTIVGAGAAEGAVDAGNMLKPALARGELRVVGATTLDEYRKRIEKDPALERRFQPVFVAPPSVEDTVAILRGLKERYEVHHGVRITDDAIIAAAKLSDRYIGGRFLPDKAIDLIDEAASRLRMEVDSKPEELDELDRRIIQLKIEEQALAKESDDASKERLEHLREDLANLEQRSSELTTRWQGERDKIHAEARIKEDLDAARLELEQAQRAGDLAKAGELQYGRIPELENKLKEAEGHTANALLREEVTEEDIAGVVARWTGIPVDRMLEGERDKLLKMEEVLGKRVIGQEAAVEAVSKAVRRARAGLKDPGRPLGSFLFLGPTGVGKTELTKALAGFLFDDDSAMVRIDMSEFMEKHAVARLIGAPPGYVGYEEGGVLTESVRRRPYQVVLFDEVEKAHSDVFNVLLQVLDDGRLTDGQGRVVDFSNTLIILTSNLGSQYLSNMTDDQQVSDVEPQVMDVVRGHFRPEFLNRLDEIILFHRLSMENMAPIVELQVARVQKLLADRKIELELTDAAKRWLGRVGYDPVYGARPLKRAVQRYVQDPLAERLLQGEIPDGSTVKIDEGDGELAISVD